MKEEKFIIKLYMHKHKVCADAVYNNKSCVASAYVLGEYFPLANRWDKSLQTMLKCLYANFQGDCFSRPGRYYRFVRFDANEASIKNQLIRVIKTENDIAYIEAIYAQVPKAMPPGMEE